MEMNDRYYSYIAALATRDAMMVALFGYACSLVLAWLLVDWIIPVKWREPIKRFFMLSAIPVCAFTVIYSAYTFAVAP